MTYYVAWYKRCIGQLDLFLVWTKLENTKRSGRHIKGCIERIKLCCANHKSISRWSLKKRKVLKEKYIRKYIKVKRKGKEIVMRQKRASRDIRDMLLQSKPIKLGNRYYFITHCNTIPINHLLCVGSIYKLGV